MIESYQEQQELTVQDTDEIRFATIHAVYSDGISLILDGSDEPSAKHYKCNQYCKFSAGQRVYLARDSGSYVVLFPIGSPGVNVVADSATTAATAANFTGKHTGSTLGFFNHASGNSKQSVSSLNTNATLSNVISQFNSLLTALKNYNLIG